MNLKPNLADTRKRKADPLYKSRVMTSLLIFVCLQAVSCFALADRHQTSSCLIPLLRLSINNSKPLVNSDETVRHDIMTIAATPYRVSVSGLQNKSNGYLQGYCDGQTRALITLEPPSGVRQISHELKTARDYARFLLKNYDRAFVYLSNFNGADIPFFDGFILNPESGLPLANVSMKYISLKAQNPTFQKFADHLQDYLTYKRQFRAVSSPLNWLNAAQKHLLNAKFYASEFYHENILHAGVLASLFGLFKPNGEPTRKREIITVVDMRDSGYKMEWFLNNTRIQKNLMLIAQDHSHQNQSFTLLWSDSKVIEVNEDKIRVFTK